jgi:hypothetical protein
VSDILKDFVEVKLHNDEDFLKICETLTRMGVTAKNENKLYQSCVLFHRRGQYFIAHFKNMLKFDGYEVDLTDEDRQRRNKIAALLEQWNLLTVLNPAQIEDQIEISKIRIIAFSDKKNWELCTKYRVGRKN